MHIIEIFIILMYITILILIDAPDIQYICATLALIFLTDISDIVIIYITFDNNS